MSPIVAKQNSQATNL